ncbi:MAG TPA: superoxide dismutase [Rhizomicrobium sp.]|nr:superoxide dismutase [Rhizomicrobium sp.]
MPEGDIHSELTRMAYKALRDAPPELPDAASRFLDKIGRTPPLLAPLPFGETALAPVISKAAVDVHYDQHHRAYIQKVRMLTKNSPFLGRPLEEILMRTADRPEWRSLFNNAGQAWNHRFYWNSLCANPAEPSPAFGHAIKRGFGSFNLLKELLVAACISQFGNGWIWLVLDRGSLRVLATGNGDNPIVRGHIPLLAIDVWEHAYYLDYQGRRGDYARAVVNRLLNWDFASACFEKATWPAADDRAAQN